MELIKIIITDDHPMVLQGLKSMLESLPKYKVVGLYSSGNDLLEHYENNKPHVILLDINLPDINGMEICKRIKRQNADIKIIAISNHDEISFVRRMMKNGADGYLLKNTDISILKKAIDAVLNGTIYIQQELEQKMLFKPVNKGTSNILNIKLTRREKEVLQAIANEKTTDEISKSLFISTKTVETHRSNLMLKFGTKNSVGLVKLAIENGFL